MTRRLHEGTAVLAALALAGPAMLAHAAPGASASASFRVTVQLAHTVRLQSDHPATVRVTDADVSRGQIAIRGRLDVRIDDPAGYALQARLTDPSFTGFRIEGLPRVIEGNGASAWIAMPPAAVRDDHEPRAVEYRFRIAPGTPPGEHPWPLRLTLQPG